MVHMILQILYYVLVALIVGHVLISYFPQWRYHRFGEIVFRLSDPLLQPFRRLIPPIPTSSGASLDLSPLACLFAAFVLMAVIEYVLAAARIR